MSNKSEEDKKLILDAKKSFTVVYFFASVLNLPYRQTHTDIRFDTCVDCGTSEGSMKVRVTQKNQASNERWFCYACERGGDVLDAACIAWQMTPYDAARQLLGHRPENVRNWVAKNVPTLSDRPIRDDVAVAEVVKLLIDAELPLNETVRKYFRSRSLDDSVIEEARRRRLLIGLHSSPSANKGMLEEICGRDLLHRAGMWRENRDAPVAIYRHFAFATHGGRAIEFRLARPPREKESKWISYGAMSPFFWKGSSEGKYLITEGVSDLISAVALGHTEDIIGLPGCQRWKGTWFARMAGKSVILGLDGDKAGMRAVDGRSDEDLDRYQDTEKRLHAMGLKRCLEHLGAEVCRFPFPQQFVDATESETERDLNGLLRWTKTGSSLRAAA